MKNKKEKVLAKVEVYLKKYATDNSIYYEELKKSYADYKNLELPDKVTNDLYIKHLNELCDFIKSKRNANYIISMLIMFSIFIIILSTFTTIKYFNLSNDLKMNIFKYNGSTSLNVNFYNSDNFSAMMQSDEYSFMSLSPLKFSILANNKLADGVPVHYDVYIVEQNDDVSKDDLLSKDEFLYNVNSKTRESGIKALKNATLKKDKLLIFSGETVTNKQEELELRIWIDINNNVDYLNKQYKFKIYVDGYVM